jgi:hypothetical protein
MATIFQFDECSDCVSFIKKCNKQGLAVARRFKKKHRRTGLKDPQMLPIYLGLGGVLITFDNDMIDDHEDDVPERSPGIIIIEHSDAVPYTLTQASVEKIIGRFKSILPDWHQVPWANSIVRITERSVAIGRKFKTGVAYDCHADLADVNCDQQIRNHLVQNAQSEGAQNG